jgi:hypothetical protein
MLKLFFSYSVLGIFILSAAESCIKRDTPFACNYFASCQWTADNKCVLLPRGFNCDTDDYVLYKSFKPITYYSAEKEAIHDHTLKED